MPTFFSALPVDAAISPRYVILLHDWPFIHWDVLLQKQAVLRSWRLFEQPRVVEHGELQQLPAQQQPDHRLFYLDYEGPVSNHRGTVQRWDAGHLAWIDDEPGKAVVRLWGQKWQGQLTLIQSATLSSGAASNSGECSTLNAAPDQAAGQPTGLKSRNEQPDRGPDPDWRATFLADPNPAM